MSSPKPLMTLAEAAACTPFNPEHLRRCIRTTNPTPTMPALRAKKDGRGRYLITDTALREWISAMEDA